MALPDPSPINATRGVCLPDPIRHLIEDRYWAPIGAAAAFERWFDDDEFHAAPDRHPALFSDHGVVHVRDIAANAALLAESLNGSLLPQRDEAGTRVVAGVAVLLAYVHDIGMVEPTASGRRVHPQFAAQTVLGPGFDDLAEALWESDAGGLRTRLEAVGAEVLEGDAFAVPMRLVAREVLACALAHSKSAIPSPVLDDRRRLRDALVRGACTSLARQQDPAWQSEGRDRACPSEIVGQYDDVDAQAFVWLTDGRAPLRALADDVIDAVRVLRAADALRQRGTTLRTSAGYELCVERTTGELVVGLRTMDERRSHLLRFPNPIGAAEANLRHTWLTADGRLSVGFYRGSFPCDDVRRRLLHVTADVVADIEADALGSFATVGSVDPADRTVDLWSPPDDPTFAVDLAAALEARYPCLTGRIRARTGASEAVTAPDVAWASGGHPIDPRSADAVALFDHLAAHGLRTDAIDIDAALESARRVTVAKGTTLLQPGTEASMVLVPLGPGLAVVPSGGYATRPLHPWLPVGVTGVVRGGERNAAVVAEADTDVLVVSAEVYLAEWFRPYDLDMLRRWDEETR